MIKLFSLKQQKKEEESAGGTKGTSKKASAAQLRIQKGVCVWGGWGRGSQYGPSVVRVLGPVWSHDGVCGSPSVELALIPIGLHLGLWAGTSVAQCGACSGPSMVSGLVPLWPSMEYIVVQV